jgi:hypothetical protein
VTTTFEKMLILLTISIVLSFAINVLATSTEETWTLEPPSYAPGDQFGASVAISGSFVVVGNNAADDVTVASSVHIFEKVGVVNSTNYDLKHTFTGQIGSYYGRAVAIDGNTILVGAADYSVANSDGSYNYMGAVYMYQYISAAWHEVAVIKAVDESFTPTAAVFSEKTMSPTPAPAATIIKTPTKFGTPLLEKEIRRRRRLSAVGASTDLFGYSVAVIDEKFLAVGAPDVNPQGEICMNI